MNADDLLAIYDRAVDIPDATGRLRRFVLDLAVRGKLVQQDLNDEPASALLERINQEKARPAKRKRVSRASATDRDSGHQLPFNLPAGWAKTSIGGICSKTGSGSTPRGGKKAYTESGIVFLRSQNIHNDGLRLTDVAYIDPATHKRMSGTAVRPSDLLLNITGGSIGRCCLVPDDLDQANISQHVSIIRIAIDGPQRFLHYVILAPYFQAFILDEQTGAGRGGLPKYKMDRIPVALPPLAEQHRIVSKVDELMALCDHLEKARLARKEARAQLTKTTLARLSEPEADTATFRSHARFAIEALPALTARADHLQSLRRTIFDLAVHGRLVEQDPDRERPTISPTSLLQCEGSDMSLPVNWCRPRLGEILDFQYGKALKANQRNREGPIPVYGSNGILGFTTEPLTKRSCVIVGRKGSAGALNKCIGPSWTTDVAYYVEAPDFLNLHFLYISLSVLNLDTLAKGVKPGLSRSDVYNEHMSVPPLAEQQRIVAKVDELLALCDGLEAGLSTVNASRSHLLESALSAAL